MLMQIIYCEKDDQAPVTKGRSQNHLIVCNGETGEVFRATDIRLAPNGISPPDLLLFNAPNKISLAAHVDSRADVIGYVDSGKMYFFENYNGPISDLATQILCSMATTEDRARTLAAKDAFDAGGIQPITSFNYRSGLRNG